MPDLTKYSKDVNTAEEQLLRNAYAAFNSRDIDAALSTMDLNVEWPNGMEGGIEYGQDAVRAYWKRQWSMINPHVEPLQFQKAGDGRIVVDVHQVVRDLEENIIFDQMVQHIYSIENGLIQNMEIRK
jgi:hypothetical protein